MVKAGCAEYSQRNRYGVNSLRPPVVFVAFRVEEQMEFGKSTSTALLMCCVANLLACGGPARSPAALVSDALSAHSLSHITVEYDSSAKVVHLKGIATSEAERNRAGDVASQALGASGSIANDVTVQTVEEPEVSADDTIEAEVRRLVDRDRSLRQRVVRIRVTEGVVDVSGVVASTRERNRVTALVRSISGVKEVINRLKVKRANAPSKAPRLKR